MPLGMEGVAEAEAAGSSRRRRGASTGRPGFPAAAFHAAPFSAPRPGQLPQLARRLCARLLLLALVLAGLAGAAAAQPAGPMSRPPAATLAAAPAAPPAAAEPGASPWTGPEMVQLRLLAARAAVPEGAASLRLGLEARMQPGWKIYWRSPGSSGLPPRLDWSGSANLAAAPALAWPAPTRFEIFGIPAYGYGGEVVLPVTARLAAPGAAAALRLKAEVLVCSEVCVPAEAALALDLPAAASGGGGVPAATEAAHRIERFQGRVPVPAAAAGVAIERASLARGARGAVLTVAARGLAPFVSPDLFIEGLGEIDLPRAPRVSLAEGNRLARFEMPLATSAATAAARAAEAGGPVLGLVLADAGTGMAVEAWAPIGMVAGDPAGGTGGLAAALALALLGGLVLNLMPCVLPVLSLKLLGVVGVGGAAPRRVRAGFLATAAGILASFLLLGGALAALKAGGAAVGWGIQFQQPAFLAGMAALVSLFAANLWGLFHVPLPAWAGGLGAATMAGGGGAGADAGGPRRPSLAGDFAAGMLATLLATPCSAPFVGTAVGFALASETAAILAVFLALGLGLAVPWLAVAAFPGLATWLPRPGLWMIRLRQTLGIALLGTALWLVAVLEAQAGTAAAAAVAALLVALLAALVAARGRRVGLALAMVLAVATLPAPALFPSPSADAAAARRGPDAETGVAWRPFAAAEAERLARAGSLVLVDITAEWCITCRVNKAMVLERGAVRARLAAAGGDVVPLRGDWTRPDPAIAAYLQSFGRFGIPFNAVYGPGAPGGIALPEILTEQAVLAALAEAARR